MKNFREEKRKKIIRIISILLIISMLLGIIVPFISLF